MKVGCRIKTGVLLTVLVFAFAPAPHQAKQPGSVLVEFKPVKENLILGEILFFSISIENNSDEVLYLRGTNVKSGSVVLMVSRDDLKYRRYANSNWGVAKIAPRPFRPGASAKSSGKMFWNFSKSTRNLSDLAIRKIQRSQLTRNYVFDSPGIYFVKARLYYPVGKEMKFVDSKPARVIVSDADGEELAIWNAIKDKPNLGYFLQEGDSRSHKKEEKESDAQIVKALLDRYPTSQLSQFLRASIDSFNKKNESRN